MKIVTDGITEPTVNAEQLRWALSVVISINGGHDQPWEDTDESYRILKEASRNKNWIMYIP